VCNTGPDNFSKGTDNCNMGTDNCNKGTDNRSDGRALLQTELTPTVRFQQRLPLLPMTKDAAVSHCRLNPVPAAGAVAVALPLSFVGTM
jgi:hypothetical protein